MSHPPPPIDGLNLLQKTSQQIGRSLSFRLMLMAALVLVSLIPMAFVSHLIQERQGLQSAARDEIAQQWAGPQTLTGPVLSLPYRKQTVQQVIDPNNLSAAPQNKVIASTAYLHLLPETLQITGSLAPEMRQRSLYEMVVYRSELKISGRFDPALLQNLPVAADQIQWDQAILSLGVADLRGIEDRVNFSWAGKALPLEPGVPGEALFARGIHQRVALKADQRALGFEVSLKLKGHEQLQFVPVGKTTEVSLEAPWHSPSFSGAFLPDQRELQPEAFSARWKVLHLNRNYPQRWHESQVSPEELAQSAFGVHLLQPANHYQRVERVVKYALLFIGLTFMTFFFVEVLTRRLLHPLHYLLVGLALCVFYTLLLALSEQIGFSRAYLVSAGMTLGLISAYTTGFLRSLRLGAVTGGVLLVLYGFIYVTLYQERYALLMGSLGLFAVLGLVMFFSLRLDLGTAAEQN